MSVQGTHSAVLRLDSSDANDLARLHPWLDSETKGLSRTMRHAVRVALEEVVMNVAMHACPPDESGEISVMSRTFGDGFTVVVEDSGPQFDPLAAPSPERAASLLESEPGGLGLTLLRHYCKDMRYERVGARNRLTMNFPIDPGPLARTPAG